MIGIAIITFNREERFEYILKSILKHAPSECHIVVVNDGEPYGTTMPSVVTRINNGTQRGVAYSKNKGIYALEKLGCENIFIVEDDIEVLSPNVWDAYIDAAEMTGIHHFNFQHSLRNDESPRYVHDYASENVRVGFYRSPEGAFGYFNVGLFKYGYFDTGYFNAFEHIDLEYQLDKEGLAPPFWFFPDIMGSDRLLRSVIEGDDDSTITNKPGYQENWQSSAQHFVAKHKRFTNQIPDKTDEDLVARLDFLYKNYKRK